jgi:hypothetical protein
MSQENSEGHERYGRPTRSRQARRKRSFDFWRQALEQYAMSRRSVHGIRAPHMTQGRSSTLAYRSSGDRATSASLARYRSNARISEGFVCKIDRQRLDRDGKP